MKSSALRFLLVSLLGHLFMLGWMGMIFSPSISETWSLFLLHENKKPYAQLTLQVDGVEHSERFRLTGNEANWPSLEVNDHSTPLSYRPYPSHSSEISDQKTATVWQLQPEDIARHPKINIQEDHDLKRHLLIDRSGTMTRSSEASNPLAQIYSALLRKRSVDSQAWNLHSFSSELKSHGVWEPNGAPPVQVFQKSEGQTRLLDALEQLAKKIVLPAEVIILSDGELDTQHGLSIERTLIRLKKMGMHLSFLSPELKPIRSWTPYVERHLISKNWPSNKLLEASGGRAKELSSDGKTDLIWEHSTATTSHADLTPLFFSKQGHPLLYLDTSNQEHRTYFAVGRPQQPKLLMATLSKLHRQHPTIQLTHDHIIIDVGRPSLEPLSMITPDERSLLPDTPGIYTLDWINAHRVRFYHPDTGAFSLSSLQLWKNFLISPQSDGGLEGFRWPTWSLSSFHASLFPERNSAWNFFFTLQCWLFFAFLFPSFRLLPWRILKARTSS